MRMNMCYQVVLYKSDGTLQDLSLLVPEHALETVLDKVVIPSLEDGEEYTVVKVAYSEVLDE